MQWWNRGRRLEPKSHTACPPTRDGSPRSSTTFATSRPFRDLITSCWDPAPDTPKGRGRRGAKNQPVPALGLDGYVTASRLCTHLLKFLVNSHTRLSNYIAKSLALSFSSSASQSSTILWPCSIPDPLPAPRTRLVGRRKARWDFRNSCRSWTRL